MANSYAMCDKQNSENPKTFVKKKRKIEGNEILQPNKIMKTNENMAKSDNEEPPDKKPVQFSITEFRHKLRGPDGLKYLRDFANYSEWRTTENDVVLEYLQSGGSVSEVVSLLDVTAKGDLATALPVFRAVYFILLKIESEAKEYRGEARQSIELLVTTFVPTIQAMIAMNSLKHRKVALKLLTAIVTFDSVFGREIMNWFSLSPQQLEQYCEPGPVRRAFIMFLMAFFVDGKATAFRPLIEKKGLLSTIIPNLKYDDANTVSIVLSVLKEKMLKNSLVSKTLKLNIFNTQTIQCLLQLYEWVGPKGAHKGWKKPRKMTAVDEEALSLVTSALEDFLLLLCTCRTHGVVFQDLALGTSSQMNQVIFTALQVLPKPWKKPETFKLVAKILQMSPDLIKPCLSKWEPSLEPRDSEIWVKAVDFIIEVISSINSECIIAAEKALTPVTFYTAVKGLLLSSPVLKHLTTALSEEQPLAIQCHAMRLLTAITIKYSEFLSVTTCNIKKKELRVNFETALSKIIPSSRIISAAWDAAGPVEGTQLKLNYSKEALIANLVLALARHATSLVDSPRRLCKVLIQHIDARESNIQAAVLEATSLLEPAFLTPKSEQFGAALEILLLLSAEEDTRQGSLKALATMLLGTGLWDAFPLSLDLWLGAWLRVDTLSRAAVALTLKRAVCKASLNNGKASVLREIFSIASQSSKELKTSERAELSHFLTAIVLQLSCLADSDIELPDDADKWLLVDPQLFLQGDLTAIHDLSDPFDRRFLSWLLGEESLGSDSSESVADLFQLSSLLIVTLYHVRRWLKKRQFDGERQERSMTCIEFILKPRTPAKKSLSAKTLLCLDFTPDTFFYKSLNLFLGDKLLIEKFNVIGEESNCKVSNWFRTILFALGLTQDPARSLHQDLLIPLRSRLMDQIIEISNEKGKGLAVSEDLKFWMTFLRPTADDLMPVLCGLCSISITSNEDSLSALAAVRLWTLQIVVNEKLASKLVHQIVQNLCKVVVKPSSRPEYKDALLVLISNYPLAILDMPKDFMNNVFEAEVDSSLVQIAEKCMQAEVHRVAVLDCILTSSNSVDVTKGLVFLDCLLQKRKGFNKDLSVLNDSNFSDTRLKKAFALLCARAWPTLKKFLRGQNNHLLGNHLDVITCLVRHFVNTEQNEKQIMKIVKVLRHNCPPMELMPVLAQVQGYDPDVSLFSWLKKHFTSPMTDKSWKKTAEVIKSLISNDENIKEFVDFRQTSVWKDFVKSTLRGISITAEPHRMAIVREVIALAWSEGADNSALAAVFHMCTSHSEFINVMLSDAVIKEEVAGALFALVRLCPSLAMLGHVPLYLAAYNASLSTCDQYLLQLLSVYERHCGSLTKFDPLFWGQAAISHYSVRGSGGLSLWKQVTMKSVLQLLDLEKMKNSITRFPIHRTLKGGIVKSEPDLYDPAFLLPLFCSLLSPGAVSYCLAFVHHGALSFTIAALSSVDPSIRAAAGVVLSRFYTHLQLSQHSKTKPVWLHVIDSIRYNLKNLDEQPVSSIVTVFVARAVLEVANPQSSLYSLHRFFLAKPAIKLNALPEFLSLFYSEELNHATRRKWILEVIRDGIRQQVDVHLLEKSAALRIILTSFSVSSVSNEQKKIILQILEKLLKAGPAFCYEELGITSWMRSVSGSISGQLIEPFAAVCEAFITNALQGRDQSKNGKKRLRAALCRLEMLFGGFFKLLAKNSLLDDFTSYFALINDLI